jgi:hypothetical protein
VEHLTDEELEVHLMGAIPEGPELARIEEHLLWCQYYIERSVTTEAYMHALRIALHVYDKERT